MNVVQQIKFLLNERDSALRKAHDIDRQISEIRAALGVQDMPSQSFASGARSRSPRPVALGGLSQQQILDVLAQKEPRCVAQLKAALPEMTTLGVHLKAMTDAGVLHRHRKVDGGNVFWYARSDGAFGDDEYVKANPEVIASGGGFRPSQGDDWAGIHAGHSDAAPGDHERPEGL